MPDRTGQAREPQVRFGDLEIGEDFEICKPGILEAWRFGLGDFAIWTFGDVEAWTIGDVETLEAGQATPSSPRQVG